MSDKQHPLEGLGLTIKNFKCFGDKEQGFPSIQPINIIIGRNNSGKSTLVDLIDLAVARDWKPFNDPIYQHNGKPFACQFYATLNEGALKSNFPQHIRGGPIIGRNHWEYGQQFVGTNAIIEYNSGRQPTLLEPKFEKIPHTSRADYQNRVANSIGIPTQGMFHTKLAAERNVTDETASKELQIGSDGRGVTNAIRAFLHVDTYPKDMVEVQILNDLNTIYQGDCKFDRILSRAIGDLEQWEVRLEEEAKGEIRLSQSGSSLRTIFTILALLRLGPLINRSSLSNTVLSIEEPENNLHPSLLRRLLDFLASEREEHKFTLNILTHSPICIDWATKRSDSQIIHVQHNGKYATTSVSTSYVDNKAILDDLDIRASDILQANGIVWVEGPSDRIYIRKWIDLYSKGELKEGTHYTIMFYGGKLLSHLDGLDPNDESELISLFSINRNAVIIIDSDRKQGNQRNKKKPRMSLNKTKKRIKKEFEDNNQGVWVTEGKEIENYLSADLIERATGKKITIKSPYDDIPEILYGADKGSKKVPLSHDVASALTLNDIQTGQLDLAARLGEVTTRIRQWNSLALA